MWSVVAVRQVSLARPSCDSIKGANLYIGGLPKHMTSQDLLDLFAPCGQIITARVLCDPKTGKVQSEINANEFKH